MRKNNDYYGSVTGRIDSSKPNPNIQDPRPGLERATERLAMNHLLQAEAAGRLQEIYLRHAVKLGATHAVHDVVEFPTKEQAQQFVADYSAIEKRILAFLSGNEQNDNAKRLLEGTFTCRHGLEIDALTLGHITSGDSVGYFKVEPCEEQAANPTVTGDWTGKP